MRRSEEARAHRTAGRASNALRRGAIVALAAAAVLALPAQPAGAGSKAAVGSPAALMPQEGTTIGFWAGEAVPGTDWDLRDTYWNRQDTHAYTPYLWRVLRRYQIPLYFNLRYQRDFGPVPSGQPRRHDALRIIRTANRLGVPVWGWVLIPYADGYWAWENVAGEQFDAVKALTRWARAKRLRLRGLVLDPEPRIRGNPFETTAAIMGGRSDTVLSSLFQQEIDPAGQCSAWRGYARIPRWGRRHKISIAAAPTPAVLDDLRDGNLALQDAIGFILPDAPWSELYFQAYRSVASYFTGHDPGPGMVSSYLRSAQREFGDAGQITLGSAGHGPYRRLAPLIRDVRLAATLGARTLPVYSLERTLRAYGGPRAVVRLVKAAQHPYAASKAIRSAAPSLRTRALRAAIGRADNAAAAATHAVAATRGAPLRANTWSHSCRR
jgi:hypothetical protein